MKQNEISFPLRDAINTRLHWHWTSLSLHYVASAKAVRNATSPSICCSPIPSSQPHKTWDALSPSLPHQGGKTPKETGCKERADLQLKSRSWDVCLHGTGWQRVLKGRSQLLGQGGWWQRCAARGARVIAARSTWWGQPAWAGEVVATDSGGAGKMGCHSCGEGCCWSPKIMPSPCHSNSAGRSWLVWLMPREGFGLWFWISSRVLPQVQI